MKVDINILYNTHNIDLIKKNKINIYINYLINNNK